MEEQEYLKDRLDNQIDWYDKKSQWNQKWFKRLRCFEIIAAVCIPFLTGYISGQGTKIKFIVALLGLSIAIVAGIITIFKFHENWVEYRTTCESLKHHKYLYLTCSGPYKIEELPERFRLLAENIEGLISKENSIWNEYHKKKNS